jgi:hypothetical protein
VILYAGIATAGGHEVNVLVQKALAVEKTVAQGELIQKVGFRIGEIVTAENALGGQLRSLGKGLPFLRGKFLIGQKEVSQREAEDKQEEQ